jgi:hypothetical protein
MHVRIVKSKTGRLPRRVQSSNAPIGEPFVVCETPNFEIARIVYAAWLYTVRVGSRLRDCVILPAGPGVGVDCRQANHSHLPFADSTIIDWDAFPELNEADLGKDLQPSLEEMFARIGPEQKRNCVL